VAGILGLCAVLGGTVVVIVPLLYSPSSIAAPSAPAISWNPAAITYAISPGQSKSLPISFTASASLGNLSVFVVPGLQGLVHAIPQTSPELFSRFWDALIAGWASFHGLPLWRT
jgi:hypothetical protein